jgi:hypothetical protein
MVVCLHPSGDVPGERGCGVGKALYRHPRKGEGALCWEVALSSWGHEGRFVLDKPVTMKRESKSRIFPLFGRAPP